MRYAICVGGAVNVLYVDEVIVGDYKKFLKEMKKVEKGNLVLWVER